MHARSIRSAALAVIVAVAAAPAASAHSGNPNFRSVLKTPALAPQLPGVTIDVVGYDSFMHIRSTASKPVIIYGYQGDQYARILPDGTVQENHNSPAYWLNQDRFGTTPVPPTATVRAAPDWRTVDKTGQLTWHDHRMHWMVKSTPTNVHDTSKKTKVFDYRIPLSEGASKAQIQGTLFWVGQPGGPSGVAIGAMVALVLLAAAGSVLVVRRRRGAGTGGQGDAAAAAPAAKEAW